MWALQQYALEPKTPRAVRTRALNKLTDLLRLGPEQMPIFGAFHCGLMACLVAPTLEASCLQEATKGMGHAELGNLRWVENEAEKQGGCKLCANPSELRTLAAGALSRMVLTVMDAAGTQKEAHAHKHSPCGGATVFFWQPGGKVASFRTLRHQPP